MSLLSLRADSGRPPCLPNHQTTSHGTIKTTGSHSRNKWQCQVTPQHNRRFIYDTTTYHTYSDTTHPPMNPTPYSLSSLHVISTVTSQTFTQFSWLPIHYILSSWLWIYLIIFLSITIFLIPLPTKDDNHDWHKHKALPPSNTHIIPTTLIGNIALEFIWLPGYYLLIAKPWLFYFLLIFHLPWFIHLQPEDTLTKQQSYSINNYTNDLQPLNQQTTPGTINGLYSSLSEQSTNETHRMMMLTFLTTFGSLQGPYLENSINAMNLTTKGIFLYLDNTTMTWKPLDLLLLPPKHDYNNQNTHQAWPTPTTKDNLRKKCILRL